MFEFTLPYPVSSRFFQSRRALPSIASSPYFDFLSNSPTCLVYAPRKVLFFRCGTSTAGFSGITHFFFCCIIISSFN